MQPVKLLSVSSIKATGLARIKDKKLQRQRLNLDIKNFLQKGYKIKKIPSRQGKYKYFPCFKDNELLPTYE